ncbi:MAG: hypothetical protein J2P41_05085 [Blastocatellia bacterium]|nr:hypothetical protein [Blastocatellia bacterium]
MTKRTIPIIFCALATVIILCTIVSAQERRQRYPERDPNKQEDEEEVRSRRATPPPPPPAQLPDKRTKAEFEVRYWFTMPRLSARVSDTISGTPVNGLVGIDLNSDNMPEPRFSGYITRANKIRVDYLKLTATGNAGDISVQIPGLDPFFGNVLGNNSAATAKLDIQQLRVGYAFQGINIKNKMRFGPLVEVRGYKFNAFLSSSSGLVPTTMQEYYLGMATAGADVKIAPTPRMEIDSVISAIHLGGLGRVVDVDTSAKFFFHKNVAAEGGYRFLRLQVEDKNNLAELRIHGPFVGISFRF